MVRNSAGLLLVAAASCLVLIGLSVRTAPASTELLDGIDSMALAVRFKNFAEQTMDYHAPTLPISAGPICNRSCSSHQ